MIRKLAFLLVTIGLVAAMPAQAHYRGKGEKCKPVKFTPQSDDVAGNIRKREISCKRARRIVTIVRRRGDTTPQGWSCSHRAHDPFNGLAHTDWVCVNTGNRWLKWAQY